MKEHELGLSLAYEQAKLALVEDEVPVGAVVLDNQGRILGVGRNKKEKTHDPTSHAEILAIQEACRTVKNWRLTDCRLYVTLEPCLMCLSACLQARLSSVVYGARDKKSGSVSLGYSIHNDKRFNHQFEVIDAVDPKYELLMSEFFKAKRKSKNEAV